MKILNLDWKKIKAVLLALFAITVLAACAPESKPSLNDDDDPAGDNKGLTEEQKAAKKLEIYNKLLGSWEFVLFPPESFKYEIIYSSYHGVGYEHVGYSQERDTNYVIPVLHIEPDCVYMIVDGKTKIDLFSGTVINNIILPCDVTDDYLSEHPLDYYIDNDEFNDCIIFHVNKGLSTDVDINLIDISSISENKLVLYQVHRYFENGIQKRYANVIKVSSYNGGGNEPGREDPGNNNISLSGDYNFTITEQANAGGTVTFSNGTITYKPKNGMSRTASYSLSGTTLKITYSPYSEETFTVSQSGGSTVITYAGNGTSMVLCMFFEYMYGNSITLKN